VRAGGGAKSRAGYQADVPFRPLRLLLLFDDARGFCGRVVPRMKSLLEQRAFLVDDHEVGNGPLPELEQYAGIVVGSPVFGLGIRGVGPTERLARAVGSIPSLEDHAVALFCVHAVRPGTTLDRMRAMVHEKGARVVAAQGYALARPGYGDHVLPTECMVRIR
jgi:hypothetical protein